VTVWQQDAVKDAALTWHCLDLWNVEQQQQQRQQRCAQLQLLT
jgi:hypothetical protein